MFYERTENKFKAGIDGRVSEAVHRKLLPQGAGKEKPAVYPSKGNDKKRGETGWRYQVLKKH